MRSFSSYSNMMASLIDSEKVKEQQNDIRDLTAEIAFLKLKKDEIEKTIMAREQRLKLLKNELYGVEILESRDNYIKCRVDLSGNNRAEDNFVLILHQPTIGDWRVFKNNLPIFMPFHKTLRNQNFKQPEEIFDLCSRYLRSFVSRKVQVLEAKKLFSNVVITNDLMFKEVHISFSSDFHHLKNEKLSLYYFDREDRPQHLLCSSSIKSQTAEFEKLFKANPISYSIQKIIETYK